MSDLIVDGVYFKIREFVCRCGCGEFAIDPRLIPALDRVRMIYGKPMIVSSGYRCRKHNANVGGGAEHPRGEAADIVVKTEREAFEIVRCAISAGIERIGIDTRAAAILGKTAFVHIGISKKLPRPAIWTY